MSLDSWVKTKTFKFEEKKTFIVLVTQSVTGKRGNLCSIIAKAVNKQNTSKLLRYKLYFKMILKMILKYFDFQCDLDFQITTSKMILIFKSPLPKWFWFSNHHFQNDFDFKSPLFRWFDFDFKIINIWWFCPSLQIMLLYYFTARLRSHRTMLSRLCSLWVPILRIECMYCNAYIENCIIRL